MAVSGGGKQQGGFETMSPEPSNGSLAEAPQGVISRSAGPSSATDIPPRSRQGRQHRQGRRTALQGQASGVRLSAAFRHKA